MLRSRPFPALLVAVAAGSAGLAPALAARAAPFDNGEIPLISKAHSVRTVELARLNGTPTRIREFRIEQDLAAVLAHYRRALGRQRIEADVDGWTVLSRRAGPILQTVRLRADGGDATEGTLSEADLDAALASPGRQPAFPLPAASRVGAELEMNDRGRHARFLAWHNGHAPAANVQHLRTHLADRGYHLEREVPVDERGMRGRSLWFSGDRGEALAVVVEGLGVVTVTLSLISRRVGSGP